MVTKRISGAQVSSSARPFMERVNLLFLGRPFYVFTPAHACLLSFSKAEGGGRGCEKTPSFSNGINAWHETETRMGELAGYRGAKNNNPEKTALLFKPIGDRFESGAIHTTP